MSKVVTLGELLLRLSPQGNSRFIQADAFNVNYGGGEANVAVSLANYGHNVHFVTKVPNNPIGDSAIATLRKYNVNCNYVSRGGKRLGIYFLENGASIRPSSVVYDRENSSISEAKVEDFNFDEIFKGIDLFHVSGITAVLSESCAEITMAALKSAKSNGVKVSFDLNYRAKLWTDNIEEKQKLLATMMEYVDICFGNARDAALVLGFNDGHNDYINGEYSICINEENMKKVVDKYGFELLVTSKRESISASDNNYSAIICDGNKLVEGRKFSVHIVDRVGSGDSFAAGVLHGILEKLTIDKALDFGIAAAAIKHTIPGDINLATVDEVEKLVFGEGVGRVER